MKRPNRPAYWQLDLFVLLMIGLLLLAPLAHLSARWETALEIGWSIVIAGGMAIWLRMNWAALLREDREQQAARWRARRHTSARTTPLTPVQERYLAAMAAKQKEE